MKRTTVFLLAGSLTAVSACKSSQTDTTATGMTTENTTSATAQNTTDTELDYPDTKKVDQVDDYFGTKVADPYRWQETHDTQLDEWIEEQNEVTKEYLSDIDFRDNIKKRLTEIWNYPKYGAPFKEGGKYYFFKKRWSAEPERAVRAGEPGGRAKGVLRPEQVERRRHSGSYRAFFL